MADPILHAKLRPWGGSVGIRISRAEADRLGIRIGQEVNLKVLPAAHRLDISHFSTFRDGRGGADHDRILGEARSKKLGLPGKE